MNDNHIIVAGCILPVGPALAHMMLTSQELQDKLLSLSEQEDAIPEIQFEAPNGGVFTFKLDIVADFPFLTVCYIDDRYTVTHYHAAGDSIETIDMVFSSDEDIIHWLDSMLEDSPPVDHDAEVPLLDRFGNKLQVTLRDIEAKPGDDGQWIGSGQIWDCPMGYYRRDEETQRAA